MNVQTASTMAQPTKQEDFIQMYAALSELGLTENEQRLYVASLTHGPTPIATLATLLQLPRPNLYVIISGLVKKGLVEAQTRLRYGKTFTVEPPSKIAELLKEKRERQSKIDFAFFDSLPKYLAEYQQGEGFAKVRTYVGKKEFEKLYAQMYEEAESAIRFFGSFRHFGNAFGKDFITSNVKRRLQKNLKGIALVLPSDRGYYSKEENVRDGREVRYLEGVKDFLPSFHVFANKVVFWQPKVPMALVIEDECIVTMIKNMFEYLWERGTPE